MEPDAEGERELEWLIRLGLGDMEVLRDLEKRPLTAGDEAEDEFSSLTPRDSLFVLANSLSLPPLERFDALGPIFLFSLLFFNFISRQPQCVRCARGSQ